MNKYKIIALFGPSGAGKDTVMKWILEKYSKEIHKIINCTTRPRREYEEDGKDYFFLTDDNFAKYVLDGKMLEATAFNNWAYGTREWDLDKEKVNIGVFNIAAIQCLQDNPFINILPIYIHTDDKERLIRALNREEEPNCAEICRRFISDAADFEKVDFFHTEIYLNSKKIKQNKKNALRSFSEIYNFYFKED